MEQIRRAYSYHTFLCPILLGEQWSGKEFEHRLTAENPRWKKVDCIGDWDEIYQKRCYFTPSAWRALFTDPDQQEVVTNYILTGTDGGKYIIDLDQERIELDIFEIRLKVYGQAAVLLFELEYHPSRKTGPRERRKNILKINNYGRRLYPPFLINAEGKCACCECANKITLQFEESCIEEELLGQAYGPESHGDKRIPLPKMLKTLFGIQDTEGIRLENDERMFVCSCVADNDYVNGFVHGNEKRGKEQETTDSQNAQWRFLTDWETGKELYAITNIDSGNSSCQNRRMLDEYFEKQLYLRWIEWGTIHAVTNYSWVCLTGDAGNRDVYDTVIRPFLIEYVEICALSVAQRAILSSFDERMTNALTDTGDKRDNKLIDLEQEFAEFQGRLMLSEVTKQIQGIELYDRLQERLRIQSFAQELRERLEVLYEMAEAERERRLNFGINCLTILSGLAVFGDITGYVSMLLYPEQPEVRKVAVAVAPGVGLFLGAMWLFGYIRRKRNEGKKP